MLRLRVKGLVTRLCRFQTTLLQLSSGLAICACRGHPPGLEFALDVGQVLPANACATQSDAGLLKKCQGFNWDLEEQTATAA